MMMRIVLVFLVLVLVYLVWSPGCDCEVLLQHNTPPVLADVDLVVLLAARTL